MGLKGQQGDPGGQKGEKGENGTMGMLSELYSCRVRIAVPHVCAKERKQVKDSTNFNLSQCECPHPLPLKP